MRRLSQRELLIKEASIMSFIEDVLKKGIPIVTIITMLMGTFGLSEVEAKKRINEKIKNNKEHSQQFHKKIKKETQERKKETNPALKKVPRQILNQSKVIITNITGTIYHAEKGQTDVNPFETADQSNIMKFYKKHRRMPRWVAVSRDLINRLSKNDIKGNQLQFGDVIVVYGTNDPAIEGKRWVVRDVMGKTKRQKGVDNPITMSVDFLMDPSKKKLGHWNDIVIVKVGKSSTKYQSNDFWNITQFGVC